MSRRPVVVIVGGGFSGAASAIHLSRLSHSPLDIRIVEPRNAPGMGLAHSTAQPDLRLNGPAHIHAPYPDAPADFAQWMERTGELASDPHATAASGFVFARRGAFGRYMASELNRHAQSNPGGSTIEHIQQQAVRATPGSSMVEVELASGQRIRADYCILATGWNEVGTPRELSGLVSHPGWHGNPWLTGRFDSIGRNAAVLLVGSGLTASDTFAVLAARGHQGPVISLSRRGLRAATQNPFRSSRSMWDRVFDTAPPVLRELGDSMTLRSTCALLRRRIDEVDSATSSWQVPFDEFRDAAWILWNAWTPAEQRQYLRHVKSWYDAFRFRNPPQTEAISRAGVERGQLSFAAGRIRAGRNDGSGLKVDYESRQDASLETLRVDAIINCTGPQLRPGASRHPFWRAVLRDGVARDAPCGVGVDVDMAGRLIDARGQAHERIFAVGPPTIGRFAEAIAVPYIVRGILEVARHLVDNENMPAPEMTLTETETHD
jgi:uncharacterized NAD(P)/FAD-binding protein YdhS